MLANYEKHTKHSASVHQNGPRVYTPSTKNC